MVQRFQEDADAPPIFLLSLKAGGTGLNLTRASHVFHYDHWWNPAVESQATDRAHRIGQTRTVYVHRLVSLGTLEEKIAHIFTPATRAIQRVLRDTIATNHAFDRNFVEGSKFTCDAATGIVKNQLNAGDTHGLAGA